MVAGLWQVWAMAVGKDYIVIRALRSWRKRRWLAYSAIALGVLLIAFTLGYFIYAAFLRSNLDDLEYTVPPQDLGGPGNPTPTSTAGSTPSPARVTLLSSSFITLYPGKLLPSLYWNDPRWTDVAYDSYTSLFEGFTPLEGGEATDSLSVPVRLAVPAIFLDSPIKTLEIINLGDARAWETPKNVVGHIPETASPGEVGNVYLFGHLQSPIKGEGSVFRDLVKIPDLLRQGQKVYLIVYNEEGTAYLYQVSHTSVVYKDDFALESSSEATVILVTCVPEWVYDNRLLVTAKLVGVKR
ncbi:MAG: putative sortase [Dehalococcoidia bacterium]|nr:putative sortase [Dehalococcoidia bacterium]